MPKKKKDDYLPSSADIELFDMLYPMVSSVLDELKELSKKKQDGVLNALKVKNINKILSKSLSLLKHEPSTEFLELLDEDTLPTNSDAVLMVVQFKTALKGFEDKYTEKDDYDEDVWTTSD
jgi:hypothetical protein